MTTNQKYEITEIAHEKYPFLHRIRALRDIGSEVKTGTLGGFVESEDNLSFRPGDDAWLFDDAIAAMTPMWTRLLPAWECHCLRSCLCVPWNPPGRPCPSGG